MDGYDQFVKAMSDGIRAFGKGMDILADQLDEFAEKTHSEDTTSGQTEKPKTDMQESATDLKEETKTTTAEPEQAKPNIEQPDTEIKSDIQSTPAEKPEEEPAAETAPEKETVSEEPRGEVKTKGKKKTKAKPKKAPRPGTDIGKVYQVITNSDNGVDVDKLTEKTGFDRQKIYAIVSNLKKQDKIKSVKQGVYTSV